MMNNFTLKNTYKRHCVISFTGKGIYFVVSLNRNRNLSSDGQHLSRAAKNMATTWYGRSRDSLCDDGQDWGRPPLGRACARRKFRLYHNLHHVLVSVTLDGVCRTWTSVCTCSVNETLGHNNCKWQDCNGGCDVGDGGNGRTAGRKLKSVLRRRVRPVI